MSDVPETFTPEYYDERYFKDKQGKAYARPNGNIEHWGYYNPDGESQGCGPIVDAWKKMFQPTKMLDVGTGRGTVVAYAREKGIEAYGFDFSEWAVNEGRYQRCKREWLKLHDATQPWPYPDKSFDLVTALDFLEHIYIDDLDFVVSELYRVSGKWIFLQTAVAGNGLNRNEEGYILGKGNPVPVQLEGCAVAGHVTVQKEKWWREKLERDDWMFRRDIVNWFISLVNPSIIKNWLLNSMIVLESLE